jgi:hypothetical protein
MRSSKFQLLQGGDDLLHLGVVGVDLQSELPRLPEDVALAGQVRNEDALGVSHQLGPDVLVGLVGLHDGAHVHARLVGEGAVPHEGLPVEVHDVGDLVHEAGGVPQAAHLLPAEAPVALLELQVRDDGAEVGVADALPEAVDGSLDVHGPRSHRHDGVCHRAFGVIVCVDPEGSLHLFLHRPGDFLNFRRKGAAVGVAEHEALGPRLFGRTEALDRVFGISLITVVEVLRVEEDGVHPLPQVRHGIMDEGEVLLQADLEGMLRVKVPGLSEDGGSRCARVQDGPYGAVLLHLLAGTVGASEGYHRGVPQGQLRGLPKVLRVPRVRPGIPSFDILDAELVQLFRDPELVLHGEGHLLRLRAVP